MSRPAPVLNKLKSRWKSLRHAPPGRRFVARFEVQQRNPRKRTGWRRLAYFAVALLLIAIGIVLMFIPGPAILFFFLAGALLAEESRSVARGLDWTELKLRALFRGLRQWWTQRSLAAKGLVSVLALGVITASMYATYRFLT